MHLYGSRTASVRVDAESPAPSAAIDGRVVRANDLTRRYGEGATAVEALRGVSLTVERGSWSP